MEKILTFTKVFASEMENLKEKTGLGLFWGGMNNLAQQLVGVIFGIILGRLLSQSDYGMMAMISVFSLVATALQNSGFATALANLSAPRHEDYNAVFWFNISMGVLLYVLLFFSAPLIALFYDNPALTPLCRYAFLSIVLASFGTAQNAWLFKNLRAKQQAKSAFVAVVTSSIIGAIMAFLGMAYWSLATQGLVYVLVYTCLVWHYSEWRPTLRHISFAPIRSLWSFSWKILLTSITNIVNINVLNILLGRFYGDRQTGVYHQAYQWNTKASSLVQNMVSQVAQPVLVDLRSDGERQLKALRKLMRFTAFVSFPLMFGFAIAAREFIVLAITEKWLASVSLLEILCVAGSVAPLSTLLSNLIISEGKSGTYLNITLALCIAQIITMLTLSPLGIRTMVVAYTVLNILWLFVWFFFVSRLTAYTLWHFLTDILPFAIIAALVAWATVLLTHTLSSLWLLLIVKIILFATLYYAILRTLHVKILAECEEFIKNRLRK